jgi:hydroxymethylglutaryl-CoA reductase
MDMIKEMTEKIKNEIEEEHREREENFETLLNLLEDR